MNGIPLPDVRIDSAEDALARPPLHPLIPRVLCPRCGTTMRLAVICPDRHRETMRFDCRCGFTYAMTSAARAGRGRP